MLLSHRLIVLLSIVLLSACARLPLQPLLPEPWEARQLALSGCAIGISRGVSASPTSATVGTPVCNGPSKGNYTVIDLLGPWGQGRAYRGWCRAVSVRTADGQIHSAPDPEQLLADTVGMRIPLDGLRYWVLGVSDPTRPSQPMGDERGRLTRLEQDGWVIEYPRYTTVNGLVSCWPDSRPAR
ncbi:MAG: outer membrane lipoprotein LolB [Candidatus Competibacteraceae bacterium]